MGFNHTENTASFEKLKTQIQEIFDFAIAVDYGVAALKLQLGLLDKGKIQNLPRPDFYKGETTSEKLRSQTHGYKNQLSKYLYLSSFSFFESYIGNVINELIEKEFELVEDLDIRSRISNPKLEGAKRLLNSSSKSSHNGRYEVKSKFLRSEKYLPAKELWIDTTVKILKKRIEDLKANEIPSFLSNFFHLELEETDVNKFGEYRGLRNDIAHGDEIQIGLNKVKEMNRFFKKMAKRIDKHMKNHFVMPKNYKERKTP